MLKALHVMKTLSLKMNQELSFAAFEQRSLLADKKFQLLRQHMSKLHQDISKLHLIFYVYNPFKSF